MSITNKSHWVSDADSVRITMPLTKVDVEQRLVSGYATLDNVDSQGDVVLAEASANAFARARGNIREMHQPVAVGKLVDFREDEYYDGGEFYRGIYVTAYVSKGAEATWEKVLDGTLTGFSIGGNIKDAETQFVKDANGGEGATVRFIKEYDLVELSLVDNPANQLANVFSIQKASDGSVTMKGMMVDTTIENIFWCETDSIARTIEAESANCVTCGSEMTNIGWVENSEQKTEKVKEIVDKYLNRDKADNEANGEGGVDMSIFSKSTTPEEGEVVPGIDEGREPTAEDQAETAAPEATEDPSNGIEGAVQADPTQQDQPDGEVVAGVDEVQDESEHFEKMFKSLEESIIRSIDETREATDVAVADLQTRVDELAKTLETKTSELEAKFSEFGTELVTAKNTVSELEKSLEAVNSADAMKKSSDLEKSAEPKQKENPWGGAFSVSNLLR